MPAEQKASMSDSLAAEPALDYQQIADDIGAASPSTAPVREWITPSRAAELFRAVYQKQHDTAYLERAFAGLESESRAEEKCWTGVSLSGVGLLLPEAYPKEVVETPILCSVPFAPEWLLGFVNMRSQVVPVIDLERLFGLHQFRPEWSGSNPDSHSPRPRRQQNYLLLVGRDRDLFALPLRQLPGRQLTQASQRIKRHIVLPERLNQCVGERFMLEHLWCEWNIEAFQDLIRDLLDQQGGI